MYKLGDEISYNTEKDRKDNIESGPYENSFLLSGLD